MKKLFSIFAFLLIGCLAMGLSSCSDDDEDVKDGGGNGLSTSYIVGTWKLSEASVDDGVTFSAWPFEETTATFNSNGTYYGKGYFGNGSGTWRQTGNTIITYIDGSEYIRYEIIEHTNSTCTLIMSMNGSDATIWIRCIKIN